jgi:hypothetical protein
MGAVHAIGRLFFIGLLQSHLRADAAVGVGAFSYSNT